MGACAQLCKCFLLVFNGLFALLGFSLVSLGLWLRFGSEMKGLFDIDLKTSQFTIGVSVLVVIGLLMIVVAVVGDIGACNHSKSALGVFTCLVSVVMTVEIAAGVMAFMWSGPISEELAKFYITVYGQYVNTRAPGQALTLKIFHNAFDCCGVGGVIELFVRETCPGDFLKQITYSSCPSVIEDVFHSHATLVFGGFLGMAGVLLVALVCSIILGKRSSTSSASPLSYVLLTSQDPQMLTLPAHHQHA